MATKGVSIPEPENGHGRRSNSGCIKIISYLLAVAGTLIGGFTLFNTVMFADSAPQQSAGATMALAWAVVPYCFARAIEKLTNEPPPQY